MPRSSSLLVVTLAVVLVALGVWLLGGGAGHDRSVVAGPGALGGAPVATTLHTDGEADAAGAAATVDAERRALAAGPTEDPTVGITGQVIDASGTPVAAAKVVCRSNAGFDFDPDTFNLDDFDVDTMRERFRNGRGETAEATTDVHGRFRISAPGTGRNVQILVQARAHLVLDRSVPRPVEHDVDLGPLTVQTGAVVSGRVLDRTGRPIADARVARRAERSRGDGFDAFQFLGNDFADRFGGGDDARTDSEGRFELAHVAPGYFALVANHEDHPPARLDGLVVEPGATLAGVIVTVDPGTIISGKLIDVPKGTDRLRVLASAPRANEGQAQGVMALLGDTGELIGNFGGADRTADVASTGTFKLRGLAVGQTYRVWAMQRGKGFTGNAICSQRQEVMSGAQDVELRYEAGVTVTFTALDAGTGAPIEQLWVSDRLVTEGNNQGFDFMSFMPSMSRLKTYPDGKVTIANLRPKPKQTLTFAVEALGFAKQERKGLELPLVGSVDLGAVRLEPTPVVRVEVRSAADGTPVAGATVQIRERRDASANNPMEVAMQMRMAGMSSPQSARTDGDGKAVLNGRLGATIAVAVTSKEFAPYESADLTLTERGAEHAARLLRGGTIEVTVLDADGKPAGESNVDHKGPSDVRDRKRTDADGVARFEHLTPGEHQFKLGGRGGAMQMAGGFAMQMRIGGVDPAADDWSKVTVADQAVATLQLAKSAVATLAGFVRENGVPLSGAQVSFVKGVGDGDGSVNQVLEATLGDLGGGGRGRGSSRDRTDDTGAYELTSLPIGEHRLRITHRERAMATTVRISLRAGSNAFDVGLTTTTLRGIVKDHTGKPVPDASVSIAPVTSGDLAVRGAMDMLRNVPELAQFAGAQFGGRGRGQVTTDAQGRYELRGVHEGQAMAVRAQAKGFAAGMSKPVTPAAGTTTDGVDVQLVAAGSVRVRAAAQTPFATVQAACTSVEGVTPVTRMLRRGEATLEGMQAGTWRISLMLPGGEAPAPRTVEVVPGQVVDVSF